MIFDLPTKTTHHGIILILFPERMETFTFCDPPAEVGAQVWFNPDSFGLRKNSPR